MEQNVKFNVPQSDDNYLIPTGIDYEVTPVKSVN
jgi:hypothetical protein